jgi:hypothetical protein
MTIPQIEAKVNTQFSFSISFTRFGTLTFMGLGMMLMGSSWQTGRATVLFQSAGEGRVGARGKEFAAQEVFQPLGLAL